MKTDAQLLDDVRGEHGWEPLRWSVEVPDEQVKASVTDVDDRLTVAL